MSSGRSRLPPGVVEVTAPVGVVVECWPPVIPKLKLLNTSRVSPMLRRAAVRKCAPPMPVPPSPMMTITWSSGRASLIPVAYVKLRPWSPWKALVAKYWSESPAQPMSVTITTRAGSRSRETSAPLR